MACEGSESELGCQYWESYSIESLTRKVTMVTYILHSNNYVTLSLKTEILEQSHLASDSNRNIEK